MVGDMPLLVPGIGAQGGDVKAVLRHGCTPDANGLMINSSRGIIYAGSGEGFARAARAAADDLRQAINRYR
jgi:orotidine-5'-phosphate decarboxylase